MGADHHCHYCTTRWRCLQFQYVFFLIQEIGRLTNPSTVVDLQSYPANVFSFLMTLGLFFVRRRRASIGAPSTEFRAWNAVLVFSIAVNIYLLVLPWIPPQGGIKGGDVSFFYATYCIVGLGMYVHRIFDNGRDSYQFYG